MVAVHRTQVMLAPDPTRVLARPFVPGSVNFAGEHRRVDMVLSRIRALTDAEVESEIAEVRVRAGDRHRDIESYWEAHCELAAGTVEGLRDFSPQRRSLAGMAFTQEYAFEAAALCNPSMIPVGDSGPGPARFIMSARAIGEGHISSIVFSSGSVATDGTVTLDPGSRWAHNGTRRPPDFDKAIFRERLGEMGAANELSGRVMDRLAARFSLSDLERTLAQLGDGDNPPAIRFETERAMHWLATSNYELSFPDIPLAERVLSPASPAESRGMEDARFVRFTDDDGIVTYYATYTAFDGFEVLPQLIATQDFETFRIATLAGSCARGKGMALFPRRIGGDYVALARSDHESTFVMRSSHIRRWDMAELALRPTEPWEIIQAGNCGSPIETEGGWLVLMHGVGPMRRYVLSAVLLDLDEPTKVVGRLSQPLLEPIEEERNGYVPNVVYSCGAMLHGDVLVLPYGFSDTGIRFATVSLADLLSSMV